MSLNDQRSLRKSCGNEIFFSFPFHMLLAFFFFLKILWLVLGRLLHLPNLPSGHNPLGHLPRASQIILLLGGSFGVAQLDGEVDKAVKRYLKKAWRDRSPITEAINTVVGRKD